MVALSVLRHTTQAIIVFNMPLYTGNTRSFSDVCATREERMQGGLFDPSLPHGCYHRACLQQTLNPRYCCIGDISITSGHSTKHVDININSCT